MDSKERGGNSRNSFIPGCRTRGWLSPPQTIGLLYMKLKLLNTSTRSPLSNPSTGTSYHSDIVSCLAWNNTTAGGELWSFRYERCHYENNIGKEWMNILLCSIVCLFYYVQLYMYNGNIRLNGTVKMDKWEDGRYRGNIDPCLPYRWSHPIALLQLVVMGFLWTWPGTPSYPNR